MSPNGPLPPKDSVPQRILASIWAMFGLSAMVVALRMVAVTFMLRKTTLTDYLMLIALALAMVSGICTTISVYNGLGQHFVYLDQSQLTNSAKWDFIGSAIGVMSPTMGRISFAVYLLRFTSTSQKRKWILHACIWSSLLVNIVVLILLFAQCDNIEKIWNRQKRGKCLSIKLQTNAGYFQGAMNSLVDVVLTILPTSLVKSLQIPKKSKIGLMILLGLSLFAAIASILKTVEIELIKKNGDFTYTAWKLQIWTRVEATVVIIGASIPSCRALFGDRSHGRKHSDFHPMGEDHRRSKPSAGRRLSDGNDTGTYSLSTILDDGASFTSKGTGTSPN